MLRLRVSSCACEGQIKPAGGHRRDTRIATPALKVIDAVWQLPSAPGAAGIGA